MPDGALFDDQDQDHPSTAASEAQSDFPDHPVDPTEPCPPAPAGKKKKKTTPPAKPPCQPKTMLANLSKCDGGTNVFSDAKAANGGKDPTVVVQPSVIATGGSVDVTTGIISIDSTPDCCKATQVLIQELANLSHKKDFSDLDSKAAAGDLAREDYAKAEEKTEYDGVQKVLTAFDKCKSQWGCAKGASSIHQWARGAKDFDDYYQHRLGDLHKNYYRNNWDKDYKGAFDKKHPPGPPPGSKTAQTTNPQPAQAAEQGGAYSGGAAGALSNSGAAAGEGGAAAAAEGASGAESAAATESSSGGQYSEAEESERNAEETA